MSPAEHLSFGGIILAGFLFISIIVVAFFAVSFFIRLADNEWPWESWRAK